MKKFEIIREIFATVMRVGYNDDKQDAISEDTKDKLTNTVYVKKVNIDLPNIDSIAITALNDDFSDACDSDIRIAFHDGNIGHRVILYANEVEYGVLSKILEYLRNTYGSSKDEECYMAVMKQFNYLQNNNINPNVPAGPLAHILWRFKNEIIDKNKKY